MVDILGWKDWVRRSVSDPEVRAAVAEGINLIVESQALQTRAVLGDGAFGEQNRVDPQFSYFSDTFVLSARAIPGAAIYIKFSLAQLCRFLLLEGLYTRGAIVVGKAIHTGQVLYGPAIVDAYLLESQVAKYPRIILTEQADALFGPHFQNETDADGLRYLDFLGTTLNLSDGEREYSMLRALIEANLERDSKDLGLMAKHYWLLRHVETAHAALQAALARTSPTRTEE